MRRLIQSTSRPAVLALSVMFLSTGALAQSWIAESPAGGPPSLRRGQTAVYDSTTQEMIVFGGQTATFTPNPTPPPPVRITNEITLNDVWVLQTSGNLQWRSVSPAGTPPAPRLGHAAVYDPGSRKMIIFGGLGSAFFNDTWILSDPAGANPIWTQVTTATQPLARTAASAVYDSVSNEMILFGGNAAGTFFNDVWILSHANGIGGTPTWTQEHPAGTPPTARSSHSAVYDPNTNSMIVFGGSNGSADVNDTWVLSNANGLSGTPTWTQLTPYGGLPPAREGAMVAYDATLNRIVIFEGYSNTTLLNDAWVLYNANGLGATPTWVPLSFTGLLPQARFQAATVYDSSSGTMTIFGGYSDDGFLNDVWTLQNAVGIGINTWDGGRPGDERIIADFDGDGKDDFVVWRPSNGTWYILPSGGGAPITQQWGLPGDIPVPADYDGDGKTDYAVWRPSTGTWFILLSNHTGTYPFPTTQQQWGLPGDIPIVGDFDGDGKIDFTVYRPSLGEWFVLSSAHTGTYPSPTIQQQWGLPGDIPLAGDFDGDGKTDFTVFRPSTGTWFVLSPSKLSTYPFPTIQQQWGLPGDAPLVGDFDGDGKTDFTVFRPSTNTWFVLSSSHTNSYPFATMQQQWGLPGDVPVVGDFDGDHKSDMTVWRPSSAHWFVLSSGGPNNYPNPSIFRQWGLPGDVPF